MYQVPEEYFVRLHHIRPRFKGDIENVLIYIASEIAEIPQQSNDTFADTVNRSIRLFPGNAVREDKTINNWRTEISALFGFIESDGYESWPGKRANELAEKEDLVESFKVFLYNFQYPGAHLKSHAVQELIAEGVHFKPAQYILRLLQYACAKTGASAGITKGEICHCIFNDLRCVRDNEDVSLAWERITKNRKKRVDYDMSGDVIRYAGDIIDYMEIANLLITYDSRTYYINTLENEAILKFVNSTEWFAEYDTMIAQREGDISAINNCRGGWFSYVNRDLGDTDFATDILAFLAKDSEEFAELEKSAKDMFLQRLEERQDFTTKDIGDIGETLIHGHECERIKLGGRQDLVHLIKAIPTQYAVGYDILSVELNELKRFIEVKTTISSKPLHFNKVHLTSNEWNAAQTSGERYFVYRLQLSKHDHKLFLIQDPVGLYKRDVISMIPKDGADITFSDSAGNYEELLSWKISE